MAAASPNEAAPTRLSLAHWAQLAILVLLAAALYLPAMQVPFYFDDFSSIVENFALHDPTDLGAIWNHAPSRFVGSWTLAANYALGGQDVFGYHLVNVLIHIGSGLALWALGAALIRSEAMAGAAGDGWAKWLPLIAALLFVAHPLQTQAVTYIVQRYASLVAMFYLASMAFYAWARVHSSYRWFAACALCAALALFTKQNAATLPVALLLVELVFFQKLSPRMRAVLAAAAALLAIAVYALVNLDSLNQVGITRETMDISRLDYLATQMEVLWRYVGLFFLPVDQRLEYDIALAGGFHQWGTALATVGHLALIAGAFAFWRRLPMAAFGMLFFYIAHAVESSIFPITDLAFEHRTYLPNAGIALAVGSALAWLIGRGRFKVAGWVAVGLAVAAFSGLTVNRNLLWQDRIAFLRADAELSSSSPRAWTSLAKELMRDGKHREALDALGTALNKGRTSYGLEVPGATLVNTVMALHYTGQNRKALHFARKVPVDELTQVERSRFHEARGLALLSLADMGRARKEIEEAVDTYPNVNALAVLAALDLAQDHPDRALKRARRVLEVNPGHPLAKKVLKRLAER
ncbi:hypothetical protein [Arhodomonas sp. AD133]|uniref:hypothetical protein n=1 Tax=Arhodomonas sp. AD133 TaxID=3415009 RepID=UPI003EBD2C41